MPNLTCECEDFKLGMPQIIEVQKLHLTHPWIPKYTGKPFKFCPWCGKVLVEKVKDNREWEERVLRGK